MAYTYTPEQFEFVKTAWLEKTHTLKELASHCNTSIASVRMKLVKAGLYAKNKNGVEQLSLPTTQPDQVPAKRETGQVGAALGFVTIPTFTSQTNAIAISPNPYLDKAKLTKLDIKNSALWFDSLPPLFQNPPF